MFPRDKGKLSDQPVTAAGTSTRSYTFASIRYSPLGMKGDLAGLHKDCYSHQSCQNGVAKDIIEHSTRSLIHQVS